MEQEPSSQEKVEDPSAGPGYGPASQPRRVPAGETPPGIFLGEEPDAPDRAATGSAGDRVDHGPDAGGPARPAHLSLAAGLVSTLALLPLTALALAPFWAVLNLVADVPFWALLVCYLLVGVALLFRSTQRLLLATFFSARSPTPRELETLEPAWHNVLEAAGLPRGRYVLAVSDTPHLDAVAAGGHIVAVSRLALTVLPPDELEAALAHELGHHLGLHGVARLAALWLEAPVLVFARLGMWLELTAYALALLFAWWEDFGPAVGALVAGLGVRVAGHLVPAALGAAGLVHALRGLVGRFSIYEADAAAVELGYGDELAELLERTVEYRFGGEGDGGATEHLLGGRSLVAKRIERIERAIESGSGETGTDER